MVADTIQTNIAVFLYTVFLFSCSETVIIQESDLIDGVTVQQFIRDSQYTGIIEIYYPNNQLKSLREYSGGKKYGKHQGWWENGNQQYEYYFDNDQNIGKHIQWHSNGEVFIVKNFENGVEAGEQKAWDQNGNLMYKYIYHEGRKYGIQGSIVCNGMNELADTK